MEFEKIFENNESWRQAQLKNDPKYFESLAEGQSPSTLYIGCADSRVTAEQILGAEPGDLFVHRNVANCVPNIDISGQSTVNYAVAHLKVKHIVVCGHYECGGVAAAMQPKDLGILNPWLRNIRDVYRLHQDELEGITDEDKRYRRLVELNVQEQCINVMKTPEVQLAFRSNELEIHGFVFDIGTGKLINLDLKFEQYLERIADVYRLER